MTTGHQQRMTKQWNNVWSIKAKHRLIRPPFSRLWTGFDCITQWPAVDERLRRPAVARQFIVLSLSFVLQIFAAAQRLVQEFDRWQFRHFPNATEGQEEERRGKVLRLAWIVFPFAVRRSCLWRHSFPSQYKSRSLSQPLSPNNTSICVQLPCVDRAGDYTHLLFLKQTT